MRINRLIDFEACIFRKYPDGTSEIICGPAIEQIDIIDKPQLKGETATPKESSIVDPYVKRVWGVMKDITVREKEGMTPAGHKGDIFKGHNGKIEYELSKPGKEHVLE